jgi:hypothetical protein
MQAVQFAFNLFSPSSFYDLCNTCAIDLALFGFWISNESIYFCLKKARHYFFPTDFQSWDAIFMDLRKK